MNYYDDLLGLKPSLLEPINPDKNVEWENMPMPFKPKKLVKWEKMPINEGKKSYNYNQKEELMKIIERMKKNPENTQVLPTEEKLMEIMKRMEKNLENTQVLSTEEKVYSCMRPDIMDIKRVDMKERIKIISEIFKN